MPQYWFIVLCMTNMGYSKTFTFHFSIVKEKFFTLCGQSLTTHQDGLHDGVVPKTFWSIDWLPGWGGCVPARGHLQLPHRVPGVCWGRWGFRKGDQQVLQGSILYLGTSKKVISHLCIFFCFQVKILPLHLSKGTPESQYVEWPLDDIFKYESKMIVLFVFLYIAAGRRFIKQRCGRLWTPRYNTIGLSQRSCGLTWSTSKIYVYIYIFL